MFCFHTVSSLAQTVYFATDGEWYNSSWVKFYPSRDGTWYCGGAVFYDYDPNPAVMPPVDWQENFEASLWGHDAMIAVDYTLLYEGTYEVLCKDPVSGATKTVIVDSYTGSWE